VDSCHSPLFEFWICTSATIFQHRVATGFASIGLFPHSDYFSLSARPSLNPPVTLHPLVPASWIYPMNGFGSFFFSQSIIITFPPSLPPSFFLYSLLRTVLDFWPPHSYGFFSLAFYFCKPPFVFLEKLLYTRPFSSNPLFRICFPKKRPQVCGFMEDRGPPCHRETPFFCRSASYSPSLPQRLKHCSSFSFLIVCLFLRAPSNIFPKDPSLMSPLAFFFFRLV